MPAAIRPVTRASVDRTGIGTEIVTRHDLRLDAQLMEQRAEAEAERLNPHEVISFSNSQRASYSREARSLDHGLRFVSEGVGFSDCFGVGT